MIWHLPLPLTLFLSSSLCSLFVIDSMTCRIIFCHHKVDLLNNNNVVMKGLNADEVSQNWSGPSLHFRKETGYTCDAYHVWEPARMQWSCYTQYNNNNNINPTLQWTEQSKCGLDVHRLQVLLGKFKWPHRSNWLDKPIQSHLCHCYWKTSSNKPWQRTSEPVRTS